MRKVFSFCLFGFSLISSAFALSIPDRPEHYVNDYAGLLSPDTRRDLERTLADFERQTSTQVVVAIFESLEGGSLEDFSIRLAEKWKIGSEKNDNGVILLVFKNDRQIRIEVGYGLEGALPDALADRIIRGEIVPAFREGDFDGGLARGVAAILSAVKGEYAARTGGTDKMKDYAPFIFLVLVVSLFVLMKTNLFLLWGQTYSGSRRRHDWGGGGFGGGFGGGGGGGFGGGGASGRW